MERCPKCGRMTAEKNHYTKTLICYNRFCEREENEIKAKGEKNESATLKPAFSVQR